jgi:SAM-dependent methyltransferase
MNDPGPEDHSDSNLVAYEDFAPIYRALVQPRGHFEGQAAVVDGQLRSSGIARESRILDAACGTGDVLVALLASGYSNLHGCDGSRAMLNECRALEALPVTECRWENLGRYFRAVPPFDAIFIMGNSLAHAEARHLPTIFSDLAAGLRPGGALIFDIRRWGRGPGGELREEGRGVGSWRLLPETAGPDGMLEVRDRCRYQEGRQLIDYDMQPSSGAKRSRIRFTLSYAIFDFVLAERWLAEAGFASSTCERNPDWPYLIVRARRSEVVKS